MFKRYMFKFLVLLISAIVCFAPDMVCAAENTRILVLPFTIEPEKEFENLKNEISEAITMQLEKNGALIVDPAKLSDLPLEEIDKKSSSLRDLGKKINTEYIVWGKLSWTEQKFLLNADIIETYKDTPQSTFSVEGDGIENLFVAVNKLVNDMSLKMLKLDRISQVIVEGNNRIENDAILQKIKTKAGDIYSAKKLTLDLKAVHATGYFEDIRIEYEDTPEGKKIIFEVREKPTIRKILFKGNSVYDEDELIENLTLKRGAILNSFKVKNNIERIENLYKEKNYHNVKIGYRVVDHDNNQADLEFEIKEGGKARVKQIIFGGNKAFSDEELKDKIETNEKGFFSWMTSSGDLDMEVLNQDSSRLTSFYHNNGFIQARVSDPTVEYEQDDIYIKIKIFEGLQYKVGKVNIEGDFIKPEHELMGPVEITKETFFNQSVLRKDILLLTDLYADEGYFYANIFPRIDENDQDLVANVTFVIEKGSPVYFERIIIKGNKKTRDKVIRRELKVYEQEIYSGKRLKRSIRNLYRIDYFKDIKVDTDKGSTDDKMILSIGVEEKPTGTFSFGAGYSSVEDIFFTTSVTQRNLFGRGQTLQLEASIGGMTDSYVFRFTEPWLFDIPLSAGFDIYDTRKDYDDYERETLGGGVRFSYPVIDFTRVYLSYSYDITEITDFDNAPQSIQDLADTYNGPFVTSSVVTKLIYDSRDKVFNPTEGVRHSLAIENAGGFFGGDIAFTKYIAETGWYHPITKRFVGFLHAEGGFVAGNSKQELPDYERFYLGGLYSIRGYSWHDIHTEDEAGDEIGGNKYVQFNFELLFHLLKDAGVVGVVFYDTGNVYNDNENIDLEDLKKSAGYGIRWYSPMGPLRLEYGYILDPEEDGPSGGDWEFSIGNAF